MPSSVKLKLSGGFVAIVPEEEEEELPTTEAVDPLLLDPTTGRRVDGPGYQVVTTMTREAAA